MEQEERCLDEMESPDVDEAAALALARRLYGLEGGSATAMASYDDKNFWIKPERVVDNPNVPRLAQHGYTLKVTNSLDSREENVLEGQNTLLAFLVDRGINCPRPVPNKTGQTYSIERFRADGPGHAVRLLEFVAGEILSKVPWQPDFGLQAGREVARLDALLDEISVPALASRQSEWSLWQAPAVLKYIDAVPDAARRTLVDEVLAAFRRDTTAHAAFLERDTGLIHGDANEHNLLVRRRDDGGDGYDVCGVIDLGDCHAAPRVFEVALNASYMAMASGDVGTVGDVLAGYCERRPLAAEAIDLLRVCICARLCQSLVMGLRAHALKPENTYVLSSQKNGWMLVETLWRAPAGTYEQQWKKMLKACHQ